MRDPELEMQVDELCNLDTNRDPTEKEMYDIYCWIDHLEFTRPKRNISRDFSDGVLMAELISTYLPRLVELRYYYAGLSKKNKTNNWEHLNMKVFSKMGFKIAKQQMTDIMESTPGAIEKVLFQLRSLIARKNRSILNYRVGLKPEPPEMAEKAPTIPNALTYSTAIKRRERSLSNQPRTPRPQEKIPHARVTTSISNKTRTRPITATKPYLKNDARAMVAGKAVLPSNIKIVTVEPVVRRPVTSPPVPKPKQQQQPSASPRNADKSPRPRRSSKSKSPRPKNYNGSTKQSAAGQGKAVAWQEPVPLKEIPEPEQKPEVVAPKVVRASKSKSKSKSPRAKKRLPKVLSEAKLPQEPEILPEAELSPDPNPPTPDQKSEVLPQIEVVPESQQEPQIVPEVNIEVLPKPEVLLEPESLPEYIPEPEILPEYIPEVPQEPHFLKIVEVFENETASQPAEAQPAEAQPMEKEEINRNIQPWMPPAEKESFEVFGEHVFLSKSSSNDENKSTETGVDNDKRMLVDSWKQTYLAKFDRYHGLV